MKILITGGCGFIGSNFIRFMLGGHPDFDIVNLDKLTYAGRLESLNDVEKNPKYSFVKGDICNKNDVEKAIKGCNVVVNFAAESHVDRSIKDPEGFIKTDIFGVYELLEASRKFSIEKFVQISTDEVYGQIEAGSFKETDCLNPRNPYSASKAGGELIAKSFYTTYGLPVIITRSSNNFGPYQYPEKIMPFFITNLLTGKNVPVYGTGKNVRDWLYVMDNCEAIDTVLKKGKAGEAYNIGGGNEMANIELTKIILKELGKGEDMISFVEDRKGHDLRYSIDSSKIKRLGWKPKHSFGDALKQTIKWYKENQWWWKPFVGL